MGTFPSPASLDCCRGGPAPPLPLPCPTRRRPLGLLQASPTAKISPNLQAESSVTESSQNHIFHTRHQHRVTMEITVTSPTFPVQPSIDKGKLSKLDGGPWNSHRGSKRFPKAGRAGPWWRLRPERAANLILFFKCQDIYIHILFLFLRKPNQ